VKAFYIAWKDTLTRFRDWRALVGFILAPLAISGVIGAAFGPAFAGETLISGIMVVVVDADGGELSGIYTEIFLSDDLSDLFDVQTMQDYQAARALVQAGEIRGVIYIPPGFSEELIASMQEPGDVEPLVVEVITDPAANVSPYIIKSVVDRITASLNTLLLAGRVGAIQAVSHAEILGPLLANLSSVIPEVIEEATANARGQQLGLAVVEVGEAEEDINPFAYFAPGMAIFFLMFSMVDGTRSILQEETQGTLPRLISTPTAFPQIILGKIGGAFLTGVLQFVVLVIASALIFRIDWGDSLAGLALMVLATSAAATSLGALISALARDSAQAGIMGTAVTMTFAALGGNFVQADALPGMLQILSRLTINRWSLEGLLALTIEGGGLDSILLNAGVLTGMGMLFFILAAVRFHRRFVR
jgi:ABC-2 type transport system permease protein